MIPLFEPFILSSRQSGASNLSVSHFSLRLARGQLSSKKMSLKCWRAFSISPSLAGHGKPKSPPWVRNIWAYQVFLLTITGRPDSQVVRATSEPWCPQLPAFSSQIFNSQYLSLVSIKHEPWRDIDSTKSPSCFSLYSPKY